MPSWASAMTGAMIRPFCRLTTTTKIAIAASMTSTAWPGVRPPGRPKKIASPFPNTKTVARDATATTRQATTTTPLRMRDPWIASSTPLTASGKATRKTTSSLISLGLRSCRSMRHGEEVIDLVHEHLGRDGLLHEPLDRQPAVIPVL